MEDDARASPHVALQQQGIGLQGKGRAELLLEGPEVAHEKGLRVVGEGELQGGVAGGWGQLVSCQRTLGKAVWQGGILQTVISGLDKVLESFQSLGSQLDPNDQL